jgi:thymidylate synthase (FAD)
LDILEGKKTFYPVLDNECGFVRVVDVSPRLVAEGRTCDDAIVQAARVSYGEGTKRINEDRGLIRYLMRHRHVTPFELVTFKFHFRMPIYVYRQFFRHRSNDQCEIEIVSTDEVMRKYVSMNEYSARYSQVPDVWHFPDPLRKQSKTNKQGSEDLITGELANHLQSSIHSVMTNSFKLYEDMLEAGVSREIARAILPIGYITEFYASFNLSNLLHFLTLRTDSHAQQEIRVFADAMADVVKQVCPVAYEAWVDYMKEAANFSREEVLLLKKLVGYLEDPRAVVGHSQLSAREQTEFLLKLGL